MIKEVGGCGYFSSIHSPVKDLHVSTNRLSVHWFHTQIRLNVLVLDQAMGQGHLSLALYIGDEFLLTACDRKFFFLLIVKEYVHH